MTVKGINTAMFILGVQNIIIGPLTLSVYELPVLAITLILFIFFINTALQESHRLAVLGR